MLIEIYVPDERGLDLVTNAMEGPGPAYWCRIVEKVKPKGMESTPMTCEEIVAKGGQIILEDIESEDGKRRVLDDVIMRRGLKTMAKREFRHFVDFMREEDDAVTADVWLQCAILGKVFYG